MILSSLARFVRLFLVASFVFAAAPSRAEVNPIPVVTVSAASFEPSAVAAGGIASAFGTRLATATLSATDLDPAQPGIQLPEQLAGTTVRVNGQLAKLLFVSPQQINFIVPTFAPFSQAFPLEIRAGDGTESSGTIAINPASPAIFTANANGAGVPAANVVRLRNGVRLPNEALAQFDPVTQTFVAKPIDLGPETDRVFLEIFCTGVRGAFDANKDGNRNENVFVLLGGQALTPAFAGPQPDFVGLDQVNIELPRTLQGAGKIHLSLHSRTGEDLGDFIAYFGYTSQNVECEIGAGITTGAVQITDFSPTTILAGQTLTINGSGFALNAEDNRVRIGNLDASVETASATRLVVRVPFGAATNRVRVTTSQGEARSATSLTMRTALSGYVEMAGNNGTAGYPLANVRVRVLGTSHLTITNAEGVFQLPDVPPGEIKLDVDATATFGPNLPPVRFAMKIKAGQDNLLTAPIWLQPINGNSIEVKSGNLAERALLTDTRLITFAGNTRVQFADGKLDGQLNFSQLHVPPQLTAFQEFLPFDPFTSVFCLSPFDATFTPAAKLQFPMRGLRQEYKVYRYDQRDGSASFGKMVEVEGVTANGYALEIPITETGYYVVRWETPLVSQPSNPALTGFVLQPGSKFPLQNAFVTHPFLLRNHAMTDDLGSFTLRRGFSPGILVRALRPNGTVLRATGRLQWDDQLQTLARATLLPEQYSYSLGPELLGIPSNLLGRVNESYDFYFLAGTINQTITQVAMTGAPFASLLPLGNGVYRLRVQPTATQWGNYLLTVTASDTLGNQTHRSLSLQIAALNTPPVITAPLNIRAKPGEALSFEIAVTDADANQQVEASVGKTEYFAFPEGAQITATPTGNGVTLRVQWTPQPTQIGTFGFNVLAKDNGYGTLERSRTISIAVDTTPPRDGWTLISGSLQPGAGRILRSLVVREDAVYFGTPTFRSTDGGLTWGFLHATDGALAASSQYVFSSLFGVGVSRYDLAQETTALVNTGLRIGTQEGVSPVVVSGEVLLVEVGNFLSRRVYYSTNAGAQWNFLRETAGAAAALLDDGRGNVFVRAADNRIFKATWNGATLTLTPTDLTTMPTILTSTGNRMYAVVETANPQEDHVFVSTDSGLQWKAAGFPARKYSALHAVNARLYAQTNTGASVSLNEGTSWNPLPLPNNATARAFASNSKYLYLHTTDGRLYLSPLP